MWKITDIKAAGSGPGTEQGFRYHSEPREAAVSRRRVAVRSGRWGWPLVLPEQGRGRVLDRAHPYPFCSPWE